MSDNKQVLTSLLECNRSCLNKAVCPVHSEFEDYTELSQYLYDGLVIRHGKNMSIFVGCMNYKTT